MSAQKKHLLSKLRGQSILVIDTQKDTYQHLSELFEPSVKVLFSDDQNDSLSIIQDKKPNLVFINCDTSIGAHTRFDGYEISQAIKQLEAYSLIPSIPVILYAKVNSILNKEKFRMSSADSLMITPFNEQIIIENLSHLPMYKFLIEQ
ncbi:hypothetical protein ABPG74_004262 [Tetrahymena malaccensis]